MTSIGIYESKKESMQHRIDQIDSLFTGETDHLLYLYGFIPGGLKCHTCHSAHLDLHEGNRTASCLLCGRTSYLTAGTFFHGIRRAIDWVRAICLLEEGVPFSANMFACLTGMSPSSVAAMLTKLWIVVKTQMEDCPEEKSSSFLPAIKKRSLQTPAAKHPMAEQDVFDELESENMAESLDSFINRKLAEIYQDSNGSESISPNMSSDIAPWLNEKNVYSLLSSEPRSFEFIAAAASLNVGELSLTLIHLELAGLAKSLPGNNFVQKRPVWTDTSSATDGKDQSLYKPFFDFVARVFHGVSRKYLQLYLAAFWCFKSRRRWSVGSLFSACLRNKHLTYRDRLAYVTPPVVAYYLPEMKR